MYQARQSIYAAAYSPPERISHPPATLTEHSVMITAQIALKDLHSIPCFR